MRVSREVLKLRLLTRAADEEFGAAVMRSNADAILSVAPPRSLDMLYAADSAEVFLQRAREAFGPIDVVIAERVRAAYAAKVPLRALTYLVARDVAHRDPLSLALRGAWTPYSVRDLLRIDAAVFATALYRTVLWRDPTLAEKAAVAVRSAAGDDRRTLIAEIAALPAARVIPVAVDGIVDLDALGLDRDDAEFVEMLYRELLGELDDDGARRWRDLLRRGVDRSEVTRRFVASLPENAPEKLVIGLASYNTR